MAVDLIVARPIAWLRILDYINLVDPEDVAPRVTWFMQYFMQHHYWASQDVRITSDVDYTEYLLHSPVDSIPGVSGQYAPTLLLISWLMSRLEHNGTTIPYREWILLGYSPLVSSIFLWLCEKLLWSSYQSFEYDSLLNFDYCTQQQLLNGPGAGLSFNATFRYSFDDVRILMFFRMFYRRSFRMADPNLDRHD